MIITEGDFDRGRLLPINVIRTGLKERQYHIVRSEGYAAYQIAVCAGGSGKFICGGSENLIERGGIFFFSPRVAHEYYPISKKWQLYFFVFLGDSVDSILRYFNYSESEVFDARTEEEYKKIIELSRSLNESGDDYRRSLYLYDLLGRLPSQTRRLGVSAQSGDGGRYGRLAPVIDYIRNNYKQPLILDELTELIGVSKSYLCRVFRDTYGVTPMKYLQNYRISRAKQLLISTDIKLKYLCAEVGFNDSSYFCMTFKIYEGMTPEEFRSLHND